MIKRIAIEQNLTNMNNSDPVIPHMSLSEEDAGSHFHVSFIGVRDSG
ncbi:hypothetical protein GCM10007931_30610 [Vibrio algivorus]|uniref:Uncharacterized protein n=1 Tax=Vibrio algivorus TaxID=1667024 RepID=A0ABQ6EST2_9VIBR|nr:hypothetical protein GCM10007931_30610 [Vibrio algivorus]